MKNIIEDLSIEDYHYNEPYKSFISATGLKKANDSLKAFKYYLDSKSNQERKIHFDFGNAFELARLAPAEFAKKVVYFDAANRPQPEMTFGSKLNKAYKEDFEAEATAKQQYIINKEGEHSLETIQQMLLSCNSDSTIKALLEKVEYQYSFFWTCPETGLNLKTRPDVSIVTKNNLIDIKTCEDANPRKVANAIRDFGYPTQACMQIDGVQQAGYMSEVDNYFWLFVEKKAPYDAVLYEFSKEDRIMEMAKYRRTLKKVAQAIKTNEYPGYSGEALTQSSPNKYGILTAKIW